ncbi:hypothetical protein M3B43_10500 [Nesterenkonia massiliensis]|uniref:Uncharacterized protein n=1 Tax=Nesterenkonia massiliensis TaxID=1232429 RepID=A0ABT2HSQ1_9MICC|nr:hypothetical protein [Nesterenkonia massiliensis]MCT1607737.1 hypothetical protein [Nesterenkonia massiliensis]
MPRENGILREPEPATTAAGGSVARRAGRLSVGWICAVFLTSLATVLCLIVATAWFLGGRAVPVPTLQSLLPPEPRAADELPTRENADSGTAVNTAAAGQQAPLEEPVILPGAQGAAPIREISLDNLSQLKRLGWAVPYLEGGYNMRSESLKTGSVDGVRTMQLNMSDGRNYVTVAETRVEEEDLVLAPLSEKLMSRIDLASVTSERILLSTGQEALLFIDRGGAAWTTAVEAGNVQYVISSDLPAAAASEVTSWVMITDRSRVQMLPTSPGTADRLERGFDEIISWLR